MRKKLLCYAEGHEGAWQAFCLDFDLAVQGRTFEEVYGTLLVAIRDYVEAALSEDRSTKERLLNRKSPLLERARFYWHYLKALSKVHTEEMTHGFTIPCPA